MKMSAINYHDTSHSRVSVMTIENIINKKLTDFHLNEWWNGEGFDLTIQRNGDNEIISLTSEEMEGLIHLFSEMIGVDEREDHQEKVVENNKLIGCPECSVRNDSVYWDQEAAFCYNGDRNDFSNIITIEKGRCDDTDHVCPHCKRLIPFENLLFI